jgi:hypothetical protein
MKRKIRGGILMFCLAGMIWVGFDIHNRFPFANVFAGVALMSRLLKEKRG